MQNNKFNVLLDLQWGSCGKGKFAPYLAEQANFHHVSCSHRPNAGHTVRIGEDSWVLKTLPSAVVLRKLGCLMSVYLSAGSASDATQFALEVEEHRPYECLVHPRAMHVTEEHRAAERGALEHISSTMQGAGAVLVEKILRKTKGLDDDADTWLSLVHDTIIQHGMLHEAAQGWELSLDHGHRYPYVTSRNCGTAAALDEMGVTPRLLGDVYGVLRPFPIRVGNLGDNSSGPARAVERSWKSILEAAGAPPEAIEEHITKYEHTTVTKRLRRVFDISLPAIARACRVNGVTFLILNFAQYLDWDLSGECGAHSMLALPSRVRNFVTALEKMCGVRVWALGTGPEHSEVITLC